MKWDLDFQKSNKQDWWKFAAFISALLSAGWAALVATDKTVYIDGIVRSWTIERNTPAMVQVWKNFSLLGSTPVLTCFVVFSFVSFLIMSRLDKAKWILFVMFGAVAIEQGTKWIVRRPRPPEIYPDTMPGSFSFPSGHALNNLAFYFALAMTIAPRPLTSIGRVIWTIAIALVVAIGLSRIFLGVHYFSDVMAGYLAGISWTFFMIGASRRAGSTFHIP